jgi:hypothetical protein
MGVSRGLNASFGQAAVQPGANDPVLIERVGRTQAVGVNMVDQIGGLFWTLQLEKRCSSFQCI